jgi:hypothetical protein
MGIRVHDRFDIGQRQKRRRLLTVQLFLVRSSKKASYFNNRLTVFERDIRKGHSYTHNRLTHLK